MGNGGEDNGKGEEDYRKGKGSDDLGARTDHAVTPHERLLRARLKYEQGKGAEDNGKGEEDNGKGKGSDVGPYQMASPEVRQVQPCLQARAAALKSVKGKGGEENGKGEDDNGTGKGSGSSDVGPDPDVCNCILCQDRAAALKWANQWAQG